MAVEASNLGVHRTKVEYGTASTHPFIWFVGGVLLWIVVFPWYLATRPKMIEISRGASGGPPFSVSPPPPRPAPAAPATRVPAGWHPDPLGRYEWRWWNGTGWSNNVSTGGEVRDEPAPPANPAAATLDERILATLVSQQPAFALEIARALPAVLDEVQAALRRLEAGQRITQTHVRGTSETAWRLA